jgi:tight adherence protein C
MVLIAALFIGMALTFLLYSLLHAQPTATQRRLETLIAFGQTRAPQIRVDERVDLSERNEAIKKKVRSFLPTSMLDKLSTLLINAGMPNTSPEMFAVVWGMLAAGLPIATIFLGFAKLSPIFPLVAFAFGGYLPLFFLRSKVKRRRTRMLKALPDAMDLLTTCVEAGLGIDAAMARVGDKAKEPLGEEFRIVLRTMALGRTRREALLQLGSRTGLPELQTFANAIVQAETMGVSVGQVLRVQAEAIRIQRKQRAEQAAMKAPVKIIIVLALFIFPAMFTIILGPAVLSVMAHGL